jgi:hypothetical protein
VGVTVNNEDSSSGQNKVTPLPLKAPWKNKDVKQEGDEKRELLTSVGSLVFARDN